MAIRLYISGWCHDKSDVFIDEAYRGRGLGKLLAGAIVQNELLQGLYGILITSDAHGLYEKFGLSSKDTVFMNTKRA